jgi:pimeloyl-ACP methyl ester carboxylesterase
MEWRKGFLSEPVPRKKAEARKKAALPDDAFLPAESYDLADDDTDALDPRVAEIETADEAYAYSVDYSRSHCNIYNQGIVSIDAPTNMQFCEDIRVVKHNRKFFGHHDGHGEGGLKRTMLLPSGIVLSYVEWGTESAPPIVLLHDICGCCHEWDELARPLASKYRVLALDLRGHGETTHSPKHQYGIEHLVGDLHELVVRLSLNGRDWGGAWTRPWVCVGRGTGAAIATAYAARHPGRTAGLVLYDYDPEWPKDRVCFYPYQAAHLLNQKAMASFFNDKMQLQDDGKYISLVFVNRAFNVDLNEDNKGCEFRMDKHFFMADFNPGIAWTVLREAATKCKVLQLWTQNSREWSYTRVAEIAASLQGGEHRSVEFATVARGTTIDKESKQAVEDFSKQYRSAAGHILGFADAIDKEARSALKAQGLARYEKVSEAEVAMQKAAAESARMAAKETSVAMSANDRPVDVDDDLFD